MPTDNAKDALATFLTGTPTPVPAAEVIAAEPPIDLPVAVEQISAAPDAVEVTVIAPPPPSPVDLITDLIAHLKRIGMAAKDLHYRAKGKPFYGEHLLADLVMDVESNFDDLIEVYFLGQTGITPPRMADTCMQAATLPVNYQTNEFYFESGLFDICFQTARLVERIKKECPDLAAGVHAILDKISQESYTAIGLLDRTMKGGH
jgi:hypothetical protein